MKPKICSLVFLLEGDNILLAMKKRGFGAGKWNGVGGKIEQNETVEQSMIREAEEEIGVIPRQYESVAYLEFDFPDGMPDMRAHVYLCTSWDGEPVETEEMAPRWFKINDIPYADMWQDDILWLPLVLEGKSVHGKFTFDATDTMLTHHVETD